MKPILGRHEPPLPTPVDRVLSRYSTSLHESNIQAQIDQFSATYYYVSCDIEVYNMRKGILALERGKYKLNSETNVYLSEITSLHHRISHIVLSTLMLDWKKTHT